MSEFSSISNKSTFHKNKRKAPFYNREKNIIILRDKGFSEEHIEKLLHDPTPLRNMDILIKNDDGVFYNELGHHHVTAIVLKKTIDRLSLVKSCFADLIRANFTPKEITEVVVSKRGENKLMLISKHVSLFKKFELMPADVVKIALDYSGLTKLQMLEQHAQTLIDLKLSGAPLKTLFFSCFRGKNPISFLVNYKPQLIQLNCLGHFLTEITSQSNLPQYLKITQETEAMWRQVNGLPEDTLCLLNSPHRKENLALLKKHLPQWPLLNLPSPELVRVITYCSGDSKRTAFLEAYFPYFITLKFSAKSIIDLMQYCQKRECYVLFTEYQELLSTLLPTADKLLKVLKKFPTRAALKSWIKFHAPSIYLKKTKEIACIDEKMSSRAPEEKLLHAFLLLSRDLQFSLSELRHFIVHQKREDISKRLTALEQCTPCLKVLQFPSHDMVSLIQHPQAIQIFHTLEKHIDLFRDKAWKTDTAFLFRMLTHINQAKNFQCMEDCRKIYQFTPEQLKFFVMQHDGIKTLFLIKKHVNTYTALQWKPENMLHLITHINQVEIFNFIRNHADLFLTLKLSPHHVLTLVADGGIKNLRALKQHFPYVSRPTMNADSIVQWIVKELRPAKKDKLVLPWNFSTNQYAQPT